MARLLCILLLATIAVTSHGDQTDNNASAEEYWKSVLPHTPIPRAVAESLPGAADSTGAFQVRKDEVLYANAIGDIYFVCPPTSAEAEKTSGGYVHHRPDDPTLTLYVHHHELRVGHTAYRSFRKTSGGAFIPRSTKPFSSSKLPEILELSGIKPETTEAQAMKLTLGECEQPVAKGDKKLCATSLESMVDFAAGSLGTRQLNAVSTTVDHGAAEEEVTTTPKSQHYTITGVTMTEDGAGTVIACHKMNYPYAVFYCHLTPATSEYQVALAGADGTTVQAVVLCHMDTSAWDPKHVAFKALHQKPGTPVCHFLQADVAAWSRRA